MFFQWSDGHGAFIYLGGLCVWFMLLYETNKGNPISSVFFNYKLSLKQSDALLCGSVHTVDIFFVHLEVGDGTFSGNWHFSNTVLFTSPLLPFLWLWADFYRTWSHICFPLFKTLHFRLCHLDKMCFGRWSGDTCVLFTSLPLQQNYGVCTKPTLLIVLCFVQNALLSHLFMSGYVGPYEPNCKSST